jgi:hypothetical protein
MNGFPEQGAVPDRPRLRRGAVRRRALGRRDARGQRGAISVRVLLALVASTTVTAAVSLPMAYQASQADRSGDDTPSAVTTTSAPGRGGSDRPTGPGSDDTVPENPEIALPPLTTEAPATTPAAPTSRSTTVPSASTGSGAPARPTSTSPPSAVLPSTTIRPEEPTTSAPATTTTLAPRESDQGLTWADERGSEDLQPLGGARVSGLIWVYYDGPATSVTFWLDDPDGTGPPVAVERQSPFALLGGPDNANPDPLDTAGLADGTHTVRAVVDVDGSLSVRLATFTVANG